MLPRSRSDVRPVSAAQGTARAAQDTVVNNVPAPEKSIAGPYKMFAIYSWLLLISSTIFVVSIALDNSMSIDVKDTWPAVAISFGAFNMLMSIVMIGLAFKPSALGKRFMKDRLSLSSFASMFLFCIDLAWAIVITKVEPYDVPIFTTSNTTVLIAEVVSEYKYIGYFLIWITVTFALLAFASVADEIRIPEPRFKFLKAGSPTVPCLLTFASGLVAAIGMIDSVQKGIDQAILTLVLFSFISFIGLKYSMLDYSNRVMSLICKLLVGLLGVGIFSYAALSELLVVGNALFGGFVVVFSAFSIFACEFYEA